MIKILSFLLFIFFNLFSNANSGSWGKGELKLSKGTMQHFMMYLYGAGSPKYDYDKNKKNKPDIFVVSEDGKWSYYQYCPWVKCVDVNKPMIIKKCESGSKGSPCKILALGRRIVWDNGNQKLKIKKKMLKDPISVARAIQDSGFYDGDIYKLAGIDYKTGQTLDENITGNQDNFDYPFLISRLSREHKDSWRDYLEGGNEKYKAWVMAKRTDGDMSWGWEANDTSWSSVIKKALNRCDKYIFEKPNNYSDNEICVLYYKGSTPTKDTEKISAAEEFYGKKKAKIFFELNSYLFNDQDILKKSITNKKNSTDIVDKLKELKELLDSGVITNEEFKKAKNKILN